MACTITATDVKKIMPTSLTDDEINPYIESAALIVANTITCGLGDDVLDEITKWLTAHLISITRERQASEEKLGEAAVKYVGVYGDGFKATSYGQMALQLDACGALANLGMKEIEITAITSFEE